MELDKVEYLRLERYSTGSFLTYKLPSVMTFDLANVYAEKYLFDWEVINGCLVNPDFE